jgi:hypothetical protein
MSVLGDESHEEEAVMSLLGGDPRDDLRKQGSTRVTFGVELTNSPSKRGRGAAAYGNGELLRTSPLKLVSR